MHDAPLPSIMFNKTSPASVSFVKPVVFEYTLLKEIGCLHLQKKSFPLRLNLYNKQAMNDNQRATQNLILPSPHFF
jgi:hypothetical protein